MAKTLQYFWLSGGPREQAEKELGIQKHIYRCLAPDAIYDI